MIEATTKNYWVAPNAISITLNALGDANRIQGSVASNSVVSCYMEDIKPESAGPEYAGNGDGLDLDNGRNPKRWSLVMSPTFFNSDTAKYVYVAIPRRESFSTQAVVVFPSERLDLYGQNASHEQIGSTDYFYVWLQGIISAPTGSPLAREWSQNIITGTLGTYEDIVDMSKSDWYSYSEQDKTVTFLKRILMATGSFFQNIFLGDDDHELRGVATQDTGIGYIDSDKLVATPNFVKKHYLRKDANDTATGQITFEQKTLQQGGTEFGDFISGFDGRGGLIDQHGNAELESLRVRSFLEVVELLVNRLRAQEGDTMFTDNDQIESVELVSQGEYILTLKEKYEGYINTQVHGNILRGIINTLAAKAAGVSDETLHPEGQQTDYGGNKYYTSWMQVIGTHATEEGILDVNQIRVVMYGDDYYDPGHEGDPEHFHHITPAGKNFPPCPLMTIARWGCWKNPEESGISAAEKLSRTQRQRLFAISVSDGRVVKYSGVNAPILRNTNYGVTIGELPEFVKNYSSVRHILDQIGEHSDWLYAQGVVVSKFIKVDVNGDPEVQYVDCGEWVDGSAIQNPSPRKGIYFVNQWYDQAQQFETHDVWHTGHKWRCHVPQPVIDSQTGTVRYYEPKWNSPYWEMIEGNSNFSIEFESSKGYSFRRGYVDTVITPHLYYGNTDITDDIPAAYWTWERESESGKTEADVTWDAQHRGSVTNVKTLHLTNQDMPATWSSSDKAVFTCSVSVINGDNSIIVQNQIIS